MRATLNTSTTYSTKFTVNNFKKSTNSPEIPSNLDYVAFITLHLVSLIVSTKPRSSPHGVSPVFALTTSK